MEAPFEPNGQLLTQLAEARNAARKAREAAGRPAPGEAPNLLQQTCDLMEAVVEMLETSVRQP